MMLKQGGRKKLPKSNVVVVVVYSTPSEGSGHGGRP